MKAVRRTLVSSWVLVQILLVILLRVPPWPCGYDLGDDLLACRKQSISNVRGEIRNRHKGTCAQPYLELANECLRMARAMHSSVHPATMNGPANTETDVESQLR